jgi:hypothetical protein
MRTALPLLILVLCASVFAQKPKPSEIALRDGAGAAEGRLRANHMRRYSVDVTGQSLTIEMTVDPIRSASLEVYDPEGARVLLQKEAAGRWTTPVTKRGNYEIAVVRAVPGAPPSTYRLRVSVR